MNDETRELLHQLEQATSQGSVDRSTLDDETAMLRENWLVLGRLLQSSEEIPQAAAISLRTTVVVRRRSRLWILGCVASAAAACLIWFFWPPAFSHQREVIQRPEKVRPERLTPEAASNDRSTEVAWDDDWEQNVNQTALALQQFHDEQRRHDSSLSQLESEFVEFAREVESGSL